MSVFPNSSRGSSLRYYAEDIPSALWFTYVYRNNFDNQSVTQRVKLVPGPTTPKLERLANLTNYIFSQGFLAANLRSVVHWQETCGKKIEESVYVQDVLSWDVGTCEEKPLRLFIGESGGSRVEVSSNIQMIDTHPSGPCVPVHKPHHHQGHMCLGSLSP